jgi:ketosteroid isomerase-like protein
MTQTSNEQVTRDQQAIRDLGAAYTDAVNRRDPAGMTAVYAPEGEMLPEGLRPLKGHDWLLRAFKRLIEKDREFLFQMLQSSAVEIAGDHAKARFWFTELKRHTGETHYRYSMGVYQDEAVRLAVGWRFSRREPRGILEWRIAPEEITQKGLPPFLAIDSLPRG